MKKCFFLLVIGCHTLVSNSQNVGIGVSNPQNKLHVGGGFRLDTLTGVNGAGLLRHDANGVVYGIKFSGYTNDVLRGDGSFGAFDINGAVGWLLNGNSGTNPATHFLGTIDNVPFNIRVNNLRSGLIDPTSGNTSWGYQSLSSNTNGVRNTAVGSGALTKNVDAADNTAVGYFALREVVGVRDFIGSLGIRNTAVGSGALQNNTEGNENTATGYHALASTTSGRFNAAFGSRALEDNLSGNNSAFGYHSLTNNTTGGQNSAFGNQALLVNTTGFENTAMGYASLFANNGNYNTALGAYSLVQNNSGLENTAVGHSAMWTNTIGSANVAVGAFSLFQNLTGSGNTGTGHKALQQNDGGWYNTATGLGALQQNTHSYQNSAFGHLALSRATGPSVGGNSAFGALALYNHLTGTTNTAIGFASGYNLPSNISNTTCVGSNTGWNTTSSNQVNIGNFSILWIGGQVGWFHYSDKRIKNDIKDDVPGLAFITKLKPITYHVDIRKQEEIANGGSQTNQELIRPVTNNNEGIGQQLSNPVQKDWEGKYDVEKIKMTGFFAQDVEEAAKSINYSFSGVHNPKNGGLYSLDYSAFVVPLVKAVQEQQRIIEDQNKKIEKQQQQIDLLIKEMQSLKRDLITEKK